MTAMFNYRAPVLRAELLSLLADHGAAARVLAGGTDLLGDLRSGFVAPSLVVNVKNVAGYSDISWSQEEGLVIRPAVTINDVLAGPEGARVLPAAGGLRAGSGLPPDP